MGHVGMSEPSKVAESVFDNAKLSRCATEGDPTLDIEKGCSGSIADVMNCTVGERVYDGKLSDADGLPVESEPV
jgi:hypothetical protein